MRACSSLFLALAVSASAVGAASAEDATAPADAFAKGFGFPDLLPPENLAASSLGIGPDDVTQIRNLSGLRSGLLTGIGKDGKIKTAISLGISPFALGAEIDLEQYASNPFSAAVARSRVSVALSQAETGKKDGAIAVGLQTILYDRGDMITRRIAGEHDRSAVFAGSAVGRCFAERRKAATPAGAPKPVTDADTSGPGSQAITDDFAACVSLQQKATWNDLSFGVGFVTVARAGENKLTDVSNTNNVAYATLTYGFEGLDSTDRLEVDGKYGKGVHSGCEGRGKDFRFSLSCNAQLVFAAKYQSEAAFETKDRGPQSGRSYSYGVRFVAGTDQLVGYGFYREEDVHFDFGKRSQHEYGVGFETRVMGDSWFNVVVARKDNKILGQETSAKASISWDLTKAASLVNPFR